MSEDKKSVPNVYGQEWREDGSREFVPDTAPSIHDYTTMPFCSVAVGGFREPDIMKTKLTAKFDAGIADVGTVDVSCTTTCSLNRERECVSCGRGFADGESVVCDAAFTSDGIEFVRPMCCYCAGV